MSSDGIVRYKASDGAEVKLSPAIVAQYVVTGGADVPQQEVIRFMAKCQARHLNPLAGDCYMTAYRDKFGKVNASVVVSKDYFVRTATQQPTFDGIRAGVVIVNKGGEMVYREGSIVGGQTERLVGGWAEVYDKGREHPSRAEVSLEEYDQHRSLWKTKPATMIRKVALVQALREAYPGAFGGVYDSSEIEDAGRAPVPAPMPEPMPEQPVACEQEDVAEDVAEEADDCETEEF